MVTTHGSIGGPGSPDFFTSPTGELWMAYAAYRAPDVGFPASRLLHVERMHLTPSGLASGAH